MTESTQATAPASRQGVIAGAFVAGLLVMALLGLMAWLTRVPDLGIRNDGSRYAVATLNGQAFFGKVSRVTRDAIVLTDVYYLQSTVDQQTNQRINRLLERSKTDMHGPTQTTIPLDKIILVETVGADSEVAKTIAQAQPAEPAASAK